MQLGGKEGHWEDVVGGAGWWTSREYVHAFKELGGEEGR